MRLTVSDKIGFLEICVAVLISVTASWVYVKEDLAQANARIDTLERNEERNTVVMDKLSDSLNELSVVMAGVNAELKYLREEKGER
jgi:cell division protein FtsL